MNPAPNNRDDERWIDDLDRELKSLPDYKAPPTLIPRVMAAIQAREAAAFCHRSQKLLQSRDSRFVVAVGVGLTVAVALSLALGVPNFGFVATIRQVLTDIFYKAGLLVNLAWLIFTSVAGGVARAYGAVAFGVALLVACMYLSCVGFGTLLYKMASSQTMKGAVR